VHRDTVRRVLRERSAVPPGGALRPSLIEPYRTFILETLQKYPDADRQPAARHGVRARLCGPGEPLPLPRQHDATASTGRGVLAPAHACGRADAS
jgi:hypothetical protein